MLGCEQLTLHRTETDHSQETAKNGRGDTGWRSDNFTPRPGLCAPREAETIRGGEHAVTWGVQGEGNWLKAPKWEDGGAGSANRGRACVPGTRDPSGTAGAASTGWGYLAAVRAASDQERVPGSRGRHGHAYRPLGPGAAWGCGLTGSDADGTPSPVASLPGRGQAPSSGLCPGPSTPSQAAHLLSHDSPTARHGALLTICPRPRVKAASRGPSRTCRRRLLRADGGAESRRRPTRPAARPARTPSVLWRRLGPGLSLSSAAQLPSEGPGRGRKPRSSPRAGGAR